MSARKVSPGYTLSQLVRIRNSIGSELDIMDEEMNDIRNKNNIDISRSRMLNDRTQLQEVLDITDKAIKRFIPNRTPALEEGLNRAP